MMILGRLLVAMLIASCVTGLVIALWGAILFGLHPHWIFHVLFMLAVFVLHFFVVYRMYSTVKRKWF